MDDTAQSIQSTPPEMLDAVHLARTYAPAAIECLNSVLLDANASAEAKVDAAFSILQAAGLIVDIVEER